MIGKRALINPAAAASRAATGSCRGRCPGNLVTASPESIRQLNHSIQGKLPLWQPPFAASMCGSLNLQA